MRGLLLSVVAATVLAGCSQILPAGPQTRLEFVCAVLDPEVAERVVVHAWVAEEVPEAVDVEAAHAALDRELRGIGARSGQVSFQGHDGPEAPASGWNASEVRAWADDLPLDFGDEVQLHVVWVPALRDGGSNLLAGPGLVAVATDAVMAGADRLGIQADDVARAVLLHAVGHAMGAVNQGVPVQGIDLSAREGPAGHDPDPSSVMHVGWDRADTMAWAPNATYASYGAATHADWAAAGQNGGVCAA